VFIFKVTEPSPLQDSFGVRRKGSRTKKRKRCKPMLWVVGLIFVSARTNKRHLLHLNTLSRTGARVTKFSAREGFVRECFLNLESVLLESVLLESVLLT
jgi:hypothetical protein